MNGHERISAALAGRFADRAPVMLHNFMMAAKEAGYTQEEFRNDPHKLADSFKRAIEKYEYDGIVVDLDTATLAGALGVPVDFPVDEPARTSKGLLDRLEDVEQLPPPNVENYRYIQIWLESVRLLKEYFKDEIYIRGNCDQAPFSLASQLRGIEHWMLDLFDEERVMPLLEYCTTATIQFIDLMAQTGADMLSNGDSPASPDLISPAMYRKFALSYEQRIAEAAHQHGLPYTLHICGDTTRILEDMLVTGADAVELDYKTDITHAYALFKDKIVFIGNLDPSGVLALGSVDEVVQKTGELLALYADSPRFILNAGCALPKTTPPENIFAMMNVVRHRSAPTA